MSKVIRIQDDTAELIDMLGGTFDSVDDVIQDLAIEAGYQDELNEIRDGDEEQEPTDTITISDFSSPGDNQTDVMQKVAIHLIEEHELLDQIEMPFIPTGQKALMNDEPVHPDGNSMYQERELPGGYYLETNYDKPTKEARLYSLAKECNVEIEFDW